MGCTCSSANAAVAPASTNSTIPSSSPASHSATTANINANTTTHANAEKQGSIRNSQKQQHTNTNPRSRDPHHNRYANGSASTVTAPTPPPLPTTPVKANANPLLDSKSNGKDKLKEKITVVGVDESDVLSSPIHAKSNPETHSKKQSTGLGSGKTDPDNSAASSGKLNPQIVLVTPTNHSQVIVQPVKEKQKEKEKETEKLKDGKETERDSQKDKIKDKTKDKEKSVGGEDDDPVMMEDASAAADAVAQHLQITIPANTATPSHSQTYQQPLAAPANSSSTSTATVSNASAMPSASAASMTTLLLSARDDPTVLADRYELLPGLLGKGHFAKVKKCHDRLTGETYAVKIIEKKELAKSSSVVKAEIDVLKQLGIHANVCSLIDSFEDGSKFYLVMQLCLGGDLFSKIVEQGKYTEKQAVKSCKQLASALMYCHERGVVHRDLKPENILLSTDDINSPIKIADFGLAKLLKGHQHVMKTVCGTWAYCAPEVITRKPYTSAVDNWTLGVLMYILLSGYHPFDVYGELPEPELLQRIVQIKYDFDDVVWNNVSNEAKDLIKGLLQYDPQKRLSLRDYLNSSWILSVDVPEKPGLDLSMVLDRLSRFKKSEFRTLIFAKLAANKFKDSISKSKHSSVRNSVRKNQVVPQEPNTANQQENAEKKKGGLGTTQT